METNNTSQNVRLDKWLWAARFFKTRAIARDMVQSGKVHYNGQRTKPGKNVELGAVIKVPSGWDSRDVIVRGLSDKRLSAALAQDLYEETETSVTKREENQVARKLNAFHSPKPEHRPDKKQRRQIIKFKQQ
ncbi:ribosome-associated heat shock protein Hsp15 [Alteromonas sp. KS69]|jgi:ribosome-associated heat shock protein Hsp15|uniref:ribosome-associated heat shock protein Hsp15 n=1 Tax=Alteromonas sp. KS69 TaxID=2109917 RepID=UPI000F88BCFF|nr:ribosome-associated heat shock protein Hsp15 [Alteromonas sp. KS69]RUP82133.1 ribosome-associated heat shock protein Hsp15 [Alteromonas sp. KS69]|tara:strand:- start:2408 stop:2803 length:396 start_codon:yes stop_codon:yes gene_type:complete